MILSVNTPAADENKRKGITKIRPTADNIFELSDNTCKFIIKYTMISLKTLSFNAPKNCVIFKNLKECFALSIDNICFFLYLLN